LFNLRIYFTRKCKLKATGGMLSSGK
jgi:hypothetical protein